MCVRLWVTSLMTWDLCGSLGCVVLSYLLTCGLAWWLRRMVVTVVALLDCRLAVLWGTMALRL